MLLKCSLSAVLLLVPIGVRAQQNTTLTPHIGETVQQFEARKRGLPPPTPSGGTVVIPLDSRGHFFADVTVNGRKVKMLVDTGATRIALSHSDAEVVGLRMRSRDFVNRVATANGHVMVAPVRLAEVEIGEISLRDVEAVVQGPDGSEISLLGMSFLSRLKSFETSGGRLVLRQ